MNTQTVNLENYQSINQVQALDGVSEKYSFIPTTKALEVFSDLRWYPVCASEKQCRKQSHVGYQKHLIILENPSLPVIESFGGLSLRILLINSHNRGSAFQLMLGLFRSACANGLIVSDGTFETMSIRHIGFTQDKVYQAIQAMQETAPKLIDQVSSWSAITLNNQEKLAYAKTACEIRFEKESQYPDMATLLTPRRKEDNDPTLWNTFNTIQEKLTGGLHTRRGNGVRKIKGIDSNVKFNKALWSLTERMQELKASIA